MREAAEPRADHGKSLEDRQALGPEEPGGLPGDRRDRRLARRRPAARRALQRRAQAERREQQHGQAERRPARPPARGGTGSHDQHSATANGKQNQGPAIMPTRNAPTRSSMTSRTTRPPWPVCPSRSDRLSRLPRGESTCSRSPAPAARPASQRQKCARASHHRSEQERAIRDRGRLVSMRRLVDPGRRRSRRRKAAGAGDSSRSSSDGAQAGPLPGR